MPYPRKKDHYDLPKKPKLKVWEIHEWLKTLPDGVPVSSRNVADNFEITISDANHRLQFLHMVKLVRYADRSKGSRGGFILTAYGKKFSRD